MDSTRYRLRLPLVTALLIALTAGGSAVFAATPSDAIVARINALQAPCDRALVYVRDASAALPRNEAGATAASAYRTKQLIARARAANKLCPGRLSGREQVLLEQGALVDAIYWKGLRETHEANETVLRSLDIQANVVLKDNGAPHGSTSFVAADRELARCRDNTHVQPRFRDVCRWQLRDNNLAEYAHGAPDPNSACVIATRLADEAGRALQPDPETAYEKAHDGLATNKRCTTPQDASRINQAYLLSWKAASDLLLDVPVARDGDLVRDPNNPSPFAVPNRDLAWCRDRPAADRYQRVDVAKHCGEQLIWNARLERQYDDAVRPPSSLAQPGWQALTLSPLDPTGLAIQPEPQFDWSRPALGENEKFSIELVRSGAAWGDPGSANVRSGSKPWVLFGVIRTWPEFTAMFGQPPAPAAVAPDFFKSKMLIVAAQRTPRQRCSYDSVYPYSVPGGGGAVVPALRIYYYYNCDGPTPNAAGQPAYGGAPAVMSILALPRNNNGSVTFLENGAPLTTVRY